MSGLLLSAAFEGHAIRVLGTPDQPEWVAQDVCDALGIKDAHGATKRFPASQKGRTICPTLGGDQFLLTVTEAGLYRLVFRSNKPEAERFQSWVFEEVLPAIRKTGSYSAPGALDAREPEGLDVLEQIGALEVAGEALRALRSPESDLAQVRELIVVVAYRVAGLVYEREAPRAAAQAPALPAAYSSPLPLIRGGELLDVRQLAARLRVPIAGAGQAQSIGQRLANAYRKVFGEPPVKAPRVAFDGEQHPQNVYDGRAEAVIRAVFADAFPSSARRLLAGGAS